MAWLPHYITLGDVVTYWAVMGGGFIIWLLIGNK